MTEGLQEGSKVVWEQVGTPVGQVLLGSQASLWVQLDHVQNKGSHCWRLYLLSAAAATCAQGKLALV